MPRKPDPKIFIERRVRNWEDEDPSSLLTKKIEQATAPLQWLGSLLLPDTLVRELLEKTLWAADALIQEPEHAREAASRPLDECDLVADGVHNWAIGAAAALGAWDLAGPLAIAPSLASLFTLALRTVKKIGLCYGFDTSTSEEEVIVLEILFAATSLYHRDKITALRSIRAMGETGANGLSAVDKDRVLAAISRLCAPISVNLTRRRALTGLPALGALIGTSANAWLMKDIGWAARNVYAKRRIARDEASVRAEQKGHAA